jgi:hypothetical protein
MSLLVSGDEYRAFREALQRLVLEPELEHLTPQDIDSSLWEFICALFLKRHTFKNTDQRCRRVKAYLRDIAKPHTTFEVVILLEDLRVEAPLNVAEVRIEHWGNQQAKEWAIFESSDLTEDFLDKTVAIVSVMAGKVDRAVERAQVRVDRALDVLRFGLTASSPIRTRENEVMFRQGHMQLVREEGGARSHRWDLRRRPLQATLSVPEISKTVSYLEAVERLISNEKLGPKLRKRFSLALHWIATAITRTDYDEKLVDICTALESLLVEKSDHWKGELIALRAILLQCAVDGRFADTFPLLGLYELRSRVVHGSDVGVIGEGQYTYLFDTATRLVMQAVQLVNRNPAITSFRHFRNVLESADMLDVAVRWFQRYGKDGQTIVDEAKKLLAGRRQRGPRITA